MAALRKLRVHEYEAKRILANHGVPVPKGILVSKESQSTFSNLPQNLKFPVVIKAQLFTTDRAKIGAIKFAQSIEEARSLLKEMFASTPRGLTVTNVLVEEKLEISREIYVSIRVDREKKMPAILVGNFGGSGVECQSRENFSETLVDPLLSLQDFQLKNLARKTGLSSFQGKLSEVLKGLYSTFLETDAEILEVNPLSIDSAGNFVALDAKMSIDDYAMFRVDEGLQGERDVQTPLDLGAKRLGLRAVRLMGDIVVMAIGAGSLLITMDTLASYGGNPLVAIDLRMDWDKDRLYELVKQTFSLILENTQPKAILINIFLSMARSDYISEAIVRGLDSSVKNFTFVRIEGNKAPEARRILEDAGVYSTGDLADACLRAASCAKGGRSGTSNSPIDVHNAT